jgi:pimeloyl-ACP methyl ester carboxylesterase
VALYFSIHHREMVDRLVLVNGGGFRSADAALRSPSPIDWHARQIANAGTLEESREYLEKLYYDDAFVTDQLVESNLILRLKSAYTVESASRAGERGLGVTTEEEVRALRVPTLLLWGRDDVLSGPDNADRLNAAISGSRKMFIEKAGHYPFIEQPTQFNKAVLEFLAAAASTE